ncbi:MAG: hypothetical protein M3Z57_07020 [Candidatus Dormibacteraeota bacterium]|nr:hypothetical protein [Candidatus Dormibacteraeota bacterium]
MWWSPLLRPRPIRRPDGGCTLVEPDDVRWPVHEASVAELPISAADDLRATALLAAHVHADGPLVVGAVAAAAVLQRLTGPGDPRRFQAWLLQGLYHRMAGAEARRSHRTDALARAHEVRARSVLRLAATSPDRTTAHRARVALIHLSGTARA